MRNNNSKFKVFNLSIILLKFILLTNIVLGQKVNLKNVDTTKVAKIIDTIQGQTVLTVSDKAPQFIGGDEARIKYLSKNLHYPQLSKSETWQSTIYVSFIIDTVGKIKNAYIINPLRKGTYTSIEKECIRFVENMPDWLPAEHNGKKVPVRFNMPFRFIPNE